MQTPESKNEFVRGHNRPTPCSVFPLKIPIFNPEVLKIHANMKNAISALNVHVSPKFPRLTGNRGHDGNVRFLTASRNMAVSRMRNEKYAVWPLLVAESIMNSAMGQIRCSTKRISCFGM